MSKLEKEISKDVRIALANLQTVGAVHWYTRLNSGTVKTNWGSWVKLCEPGTADYIAILCTGQVYFIETKSNTGQQTPQQIEFQKSVEKWGAIYEVVRDVEQVRTTVESITKFYQNKIDNITLDINL